MKVRTKTSSWRTHGVFAALMIIVSAISMFSCSSCEKDESPTVKTVKASLANLTDSQTSASIIAEGKIVSDGGASVVAYGFCLSTSSMPTISDTKKEKSGNGTASFTETFEGLEFGATYHVRAYAINSEGISYGEDLPVETSSKAAIATMAASLIKVTEATFNGSVNPRGLSTEVWFEYGETAALGTKVALGTFDGSDIVSVNAAVTGLTGGKLYYFVLKGKNDLGEVAGNQMSFETWGAEDTDGNFYHIVKIGNQTWLRENLKTTHYANGDPIPNVTNPDIWASLTTGAYCWYNNDQAIGNVYGGLYNWYVGTDSRKLINGWHMPSDTEWNTLIQSLGGQIPAGPKMMETGSAHWTNTKVPATNSSNFTAIANGVFGFDPSLNKFAFEELNVSANWWTSELFGPGAVIVEINNTNCYASVGKIFPQNLGFAVRLVKDSK